jgi:hypothetical protein
MPFEIDTGSTGPDFSFGRDVFMDGVLDSLPANAPEADIDRALCNAIMADILKPKKAETVRKHFMAHVHLMRGLAERSPNQFDAIIETLHEKLIETA